MPKVLGNVVGHPLRPDEDKYFSILLADLVEVLDELIPLLEITADFNNLGDVVVSSELHGANIDLNEIAQEVLYRHEIKMLIHYD